MDFRKVNNADIYHVLCGVVARCYRVEVVR